MKSKLKKLVSEKTSYQKVALSLVTFFYPVWAVLFYYLSPQVNDPMELRVFGSVALCLLLVIFFKRTSDHQEFPENVILLAFGGIVLHAFYLVKLNPDNPLIEMQCMIAVFCLSAILTSRRQLQYFILWVIVLTAAVWTKDLEANWTEAFGVIKSFMLEGHASVKPKEAPKTLSIRDRASEICNALMLEVLETELSDQVAEAIRAKVRTALLECLEEESTKLLKKTG